MTAPARRGTAVLPRHRRLRLRAIAGVGSGIAGLLGLSLLSMQVAAARDRIAAIDRRVAATRHDYAVLLTEFDIRSRPAQQLAWSETALALAPPGMHQYLVRLDDLDTLGRPAPRSAQTGS